MQKQQKLGNFISKLQYLLENQQYSEIICWDQTRTMIDIVSQTKMETQIISLYFRHHRFESFVRQLNLYGFKKIKFNGRHRFTHAQLLKGEKLQSIFSKKPTKSSKKEVKEEFEEASVKENPDEIIQNQSNRTPSLNSIGQYQNQTDGVAAVVQNCNASLGPVNSNELQPIPEYAQSYYNYWNMLMMHPSNQCGTLLFLDPMYSFQ